MAEQPDHVAPAEPLPTRPATAGGKGKRSRRATDSLYRNAYRVLCTQNEIADGKSNIMISVNGILLSALVLVSPVVYQYSTRVFVPIVILACGALVSLTCSLIATTPRTRRSYDREGHDDPSPLFFGDFAKSSEAAYLDSMRQVRADNERIYDTMSRNIYRMGCVLRVKYRVLKFAYLSFIAGLAASTLALAFVMLAR